MDNKFKSVLLFSGGLRSFIAYKYFGNIDTLFYNLGNRNESKSIQLLPGTVTLIDCNKLQFNYNLPKEIILAAAAIEYSNLIYIPITKENKILSPQTFVNFSQFLSQLHNRKIEIISPFWNFTITDIVEWYLEESFDDLSREDKIQLLLKTTTCVDQSEVNYCGQCSGCFEKWVAFYLNGITLPFKNRELLEKMLYQAKSKLIKLDSWWRNEIITAVERYIKS